MSVNVIWVLGFVLNLFFLYSVFQIYFQSPVVEINESFNSGVKPAKYDRLVFFVSDGLRADTFYRNPDNHPNLTSLLHRKDSVWGISDTRVPTESRPGHVALFAGIYEDPSAIFTGWKKNLVEFDSVFNRTKHSIALGSPDIVDMFAEGSGKDKVYFESYPSSWQDFLRKDSSKMDTWVLDRFKNLVVRKRLPEHDQTLIFLHLLGVDNIGHINKPPSSQYLQAVQVVDHIVPETEELVKEYYRNDNRTLFVFTSDHGMTDWGSHGAGSSDETETPFVIWGNGIKSTSSQLRLKQADFSALIAGALSIDFPTNSVGRFPSSIWSDDEFAYRTLLGNFNQLKSLLCGKEAVVARGKIPLVSFSGENEIESLFANAEESAQLQNYATAIGTLNYGIDLIFEGITYYERYDQRGMTLLTIYAFLVWILIICAKVLIPRSQNLRIVSKSNALDICISLFVTFVLLDWPTTRVPYIFVPLYLTRMLVSLSSDCYKSFSRLTLKSCFLGGALGILCIEILVMTFYRREIISLGLLLNAIWYLHGKQLTRSQKLLWMSSAIILAVFPTLPIIGTARIRWMSSVGSTLCTIVSILWISRNYKGIESLETKHYRLLTVQIVMVFASGILVHFPEFFLTRILAWISIPSMFAIPVAFSSPILSVQAVSIFLAIYNPFLYLSLNYEVFFLPALFATLLILLKIERGQLGGPSSWQAFWICRIRVSGDRARDKKNDFQAFRIACLHLCFIYISFFGIGNIASISSFDPTASRCFVSVFRPFLMTGLLLIKVLGPFLLVACAFRLLVTSWKEVEVNFTIVLCLCQGMALHLFLNVTNVGSWLEIGTSISHFVIVQVTTIFLFLLFFIANFLVGEGTAFLKGQKLSN